MKFTAIILSVLVLLLSAMPCAEDMVISKYSEIVEHNEGDSHSHENSGELCSPFCSCSCCSQHMVTAVAVVSFIPICYHQEDIITQSFYKSKLPLNVYSSIWQPPKLV